MSGHLLARLGCWLVGHDRFWKVDDKGSGWLCIRCMHVERSRALWVRRRAS